MYFWENEEEGKTEKELHFTAQRILTLLTPPPASWVLGGEMDLSDILLYYPVPKIVIMSRDEGLLWPQLQKIP